MDYPRQMIIDSAVALFNEKGYDGVEIHEILKRAGVTKGAFYIHFPTKEAVASAIILEADDRTREVAEGAMLQPASALVNLIVATLVVTDMIQRDDFARIANLLRQTLIPVHPAAPDTLCVPSWSLTRTAIENAVAEGDLLDDVDVDAVTHTIRAAVLGSHLVSGAAADDIYCRITKVWKVILRGNVPPHKLPYFESFVSGVAERY